MSTNADTIKQAIEALDKMKKNGDAPASGLAAMGGKTDNKNLLSAFHALKNARLPQLKPEGVGYPSGTIYDIDSDLSHEIEELIAVAQSLLIAYARRPTPQELKEDYGNLAKQYMDVSEEMKNIAKMGDKKSQNSGGIFGLSSISFFEKKEDVVELTEEQRLAALAEKIQAANLLSQKLIKSSRNDLREERAYHDALRHLQNSVVDLLDKINNLDVSAYAHKFVTREKKEKDPFLRGVTREEFTASIGLVKEALAGTLAKNVMSLQAISDALDEKSDVHSSHISMLSSFKNVITVIKISMGSAQSVRGIKKVIDSLASASSAGMNLMSTATAGMEKEAASLWQGNALSPEVLIELSSAMNTMSEETAAMLKSMTDGSYSDKDRPNLFDEWSVASYEKIVAPALAYKEGSVIANVHDASLSRPLIREDILKGKTEAPLFEDFPLSYLSPESTENKYSTLNTSVKEEKKEEKKVTVPLAAWTPIQRKVAKNFLSSYNAMVGTSLSLDNVERSGWSPEDVALHMTSLTRALSSQEIRSLPAYARSEMNFIVLNSKAPDHDWMSFSQKLKNGVPFKSEWVENFTSWMNKDKDDVDWAKLRGWTELAFYLSYFDQDKQAKAVLHTEEGAVMKASFKKEIRNFLQKPGVPDEMIKEWGFAGLILRHALALGVDKKDIEKGWRFFGNPVRPVDWDGSSVATWPQRFPEDMGPEQRAFLEEKIDESFPDVVVDGPFPSLPENDIISQNRSVSLSFSVGSLSGGSSDSRENSMLHSLPMEDRPQSRRQHSWYRPDSKAPIAPHNDAPAVRTTPDKDWW